MSDTTKAEISTEVTANLENQIARKVVLITGCSPEGIGAAVALAIAPHNPALIILTGRSREKTEETKKALKEQTPGVKTKILIFDQKSLDSVRKAATEINAFPETIDVLINNAGIMAAPFEKTDDGFESHFGINHLAHFLLTNILVEKMRKNGGATVVTVSSGAYQMGGIDFEDPNFETRPYDKWQAYAQSKTANVLFSLGLAERLGERGIQSYATEPNVAVNTKLSRHFTPNDWTLVSSLNIELGPMEAAIVDIISCAFDPALHQNNGALLTKAKINLLEEVPWARGKDNSDKLWDLSERLVQQKFSY